MRLKKCGWPTRRLGPLSGRVGQVDLCSLNGNSQSFVIWIFQYQRGLASFQDVWIPGVWPNRMTKKTFGFSTTSSEGPEVNQCRVYQWWQPPIGTGPIYTVPPNGVHSPWYPLPNLWGLNILTATAKSVGWNPHSPERFLENSSSRISAPVLGNVLTNW